MPSSEKEGKKPKNRVRFVRERKEKQQFLKVVEDNLRKLQF